MHKYTKYVNNYTTENLQKNPKLRHRVDQNEKRYDFSNGINFHFVFLKQNKKTAALDINAAVF